MKSRPYPLRLPLRVLAAKIERDLLSAEEKAGLAKLFRRLADGEKLETHTLAFLTTKRDKF